MIAVQLIVGSIFVLTLWVLKLREVPVLTMTSIKNLSPIALCHVLSHVCVIISYEGTAIRHIRWVFI